MISDTSYIILFIGFVVSNLIWIWLYISQRRETLRHFEERTKLMREVNTLKNYESDEPQAPSYDPVEIYW
jgi:hypothetical protein